MHRYKDLGHLASYLLMLLQHKVYAQHHDFVAQHYNYSSARRQECTPSTSITAAAEHEQAPTLSADLRTLEMLF